MVGLNDIRNLLGYEGVYKGLRVFKRKIGFASTAPSTKATRTKRSRLRTKRERLREKLLPRVREFCSGLRELYTVTTHKIFTESKGISFFSLVTSSAPLITPLEHVQALNG